MSVEQQLPTPSSAPRRKTKPRKPTIAESTAYGRKLFAQLAKPFIMPASAGTGTDGLIVDIEGNGLLGTISQVHCIVIAELASGRIYEHGPGQIAEALEHMAGAATLIGHNIQGFDLPALRKLHGWAPQPGCQTVDTLVAARLILPNLGSLDGEVARRARDPGFGKVHGRYSLEAWGLRLGTAKIGAELVD
jgi:hypothetical protein